MSKRFRNLFFIICAVFALALVLTGCKKSENETINVTFNDSSESYELKEGESINGPTLSLDAGQELLGWALEQNASKAKFSGNTIKYDQVKSYAKDSKVALYSVVESKIEVTMKGLTDSVTKVSDLTLNTAAAPLVEQSERQKFLGWALTEDASEAIIGSDDVINYNSVKQYATNAKVTLYPVVKTYDLMICIHASHSNGNVYVSEEQFSEIVNLLKEHFGEDVSILVDRIDNVSATNFAKEAVEKDYDLIIGSKSVVTTADATGDIISAAELVNKGYDVDSESYTTLEAVELNQSRRVGKVINSDSYKPYQEEAYTLLTTPTDKTVEVTFSNGTLTETVTVHRAVLVDGVMTLNENSYEPTTEGIVSETDKKVFNGWTLELNSSEIAFANISYSTVYEKAVDGKLTVYPVYKDAPDLFILVWGVNGTNTYISQEEYQTIVDGFNAYLKTNNVDTSSKSFEISYFTGKTADFQSELTKSYVHGAIGASALGGDNYKAYWTVSETCFAKVSNVSLLNTARYVGLRSGSETNEYAVLFYRYLTESYVTVTFDGDTNSQQLSSYTKNVATIPTVSEKEGYTFIGWATEENKTEADINKDVEINYSVANTLATDGALKLYPVYVDSESLITYDLVVYILRGTATKEFITETEAINAISGFKAWLSSNGDNKEYTIKCDYSQRGAGADFLTYVDGKGNVDVVIGASNLNPTVYTDTLGKLIINPVFSNESRWAYIYNTCKDSHLDLAKLFMEYMCDDYVNVSVSGVSTKLTYLGAETLSLTYTANEGYNFDGWATSADSTTIAISASTTTITYNDVKTIAVDHNVTLYPVTSVKEATHTCSHVCPVCGKCTDQDCTDAACADKCLGCTLRIAYHTQGSSETTVYISEDIKTKIETALINKIKAENLDPSKLTIVWVAVTGKVDSADDDIQAANVDVVIAHSQVFLASKADKYIVTETDYPATQISTTLYSGTNIKVGIVKGSGWNRLAKWLYDIVINYTETN